MNLFKFTNLTDWPRKIIVPTFKNVNKKFMRRLSRLKTICYILKINKI